MSWYLQIHKASAVTHFIEKDIPAILRLTGSERCPPIERFYKRTDLVLNQHEFFSQQRADISVFSAAHDIICAEDGHNIARREKNGLVAFYLNSARNLYQDNECNKVDAKRVKTFEEPHKIKVSPQYDRALRNVLSLHKVCRYEKPNVPGDFIYICRCKGFMVL